MKKLFVLFALMAMLFGLSAATYADEAAPATAPITAAAPAAAAPAAPVLDTGATAWMLSSTALVLLMTRHGPEEECPGYHDAKFCHHRTGHCDMDGGRL